MPARIEPTSPPFVPDIAEMILDQAMRGKPPLRLLASAARDPRRPGNFSPEGCWTRETSLRQREVVINRATALCRSEYEWGVHVAVKAKAGLTEEQIRSTATGTTDDACWSEEDRLLIHVCDALHLSCDIDDELWLALRNAFAENAVIELLMLTGSIEPSGT